MNEKLFRITFSGDLAYGYEMDEARAKVKRLCKFDDTKLDAFFSGKKITVKNKLTHELARKYKDALDQTGIVTCIEELLPAKRPVPAPPKQFECPKCKHPQPKSDSCVQCGIFFAKFEQAQERQNAIERGEAPPGAETADKKPELPTDASMMDRIWAHFSEHQEQAFILKAFAVIAAIIFVTKYLSGLLSLIILLFPVLFLIYVRLDAASSGKNPTEVLAQHITFMPVMYAEGERKKEGTAWVTYSLILLNVLIFYGYEIQFDPTFLFENLVFIPYAPNIINVPISLITSMFLHADGMHLWGNMLFLWTLGVVVEKRIGPQKFIAFYLLAGVASGLMSAFVHFVAFRAPAHGLGASGAIAGAMGLFAIRCYFKSMVFPLPILGIFSLILPISLKVRLNSLVIIGLFFLADLHGGIGQVAGQSTSNVGHWAHIGGMVCGIVLGMMFNLGEEAVEERHEEIGRQALNKRGDLNKGEESLRLALQKNPNNADAMLLLATLLSKFQPTTEGEEHYRKGMDLLCDSRTEEIAETFKEYFKRYLKGCNHETMFKLASYYHKQNDHEWAARCLELLSDDHSTPATIREKAIFHCARLMESLGRIDVALHYYQQVVDGFPDSPFRPKALARLAAH